MLQSARLHPPPKKRRPVERLAVDLTLWTDPRGHLLLERGAFPYLDHLWLPPMEVRPAERGRRAGDATFKHAILHRELHVRVARRVVATAELRLRSRSEAAGVERRIFAPSELGAIGRSTLLTKALAVARSELGS